MLLKCNAMDMKSVFSPYLTLLKMHKNVLFQGMQRKIPSETSGSACMTSVEYMLKVSADL